MIVRSNFILRILSHIIGFQPLAVTFFPFIIVQEGVLSRTLNHERIHIEQYKELYWIGFIAVYIYDYYCLRKSYSHKEAYRKVRFEQEAFANQDNPSYYKLRNKYEWRKFSI